MKPEVYRPLILCKTCKQDTRHYYLCGTSGTPDLHGLASWVHLYSCARCDTERVYGCTRFKPNSNGIFPTKTERGENGKFVSANI